MTDPHDRSHSRIVGPDGVETHILVPADEYARLVNAAAAAGAPSDSAFEEAARILADPATTWHDANDILPALLRDGIAAARKRRGLTQADLGALLGVEQSRISRIEKNPDTISVRTLREIAEILSRHDAPSAPPAHPDRRATTKSQRPARGERARRTA